MVGAGGYEIRVHLNGELPPSWSPIFGDLSVVTTPGGTTVIEGQLGDQAALHGLLVTVRDLGLSLISIRAVALDDTSSEEPPTGPAAAVATALGTGTEQG